MEEKINLQLFHNVFIQSDVIVNINYIPAQRDLKHTD